MTYLRESIAIPIHILRPITTFESSRNKSKGSKNEGNKTKSKGGIPAALIYSRLLNNKYMFVQRSEQFKSTIQKINHFKWNHFTYYFIILVEFMVLLG